MHVAMTGTGAIDATPGRDAPAATRPACAAPASIHVAGARRGVLEASAAALADGESPVLALVLEASGSTYARPGTLAMFSTHRQIGWLSGGCLEPRIAQLAQWAATAHRIEWMEIDTRDDADLFAGSAVGCRGRLRLALVPLARMESWATLVAAWSRGEGALRLGIDTSGAVSATVAGLAMDQRIAAATLPWESDATGGQWSLDVAPPPSLLVLGAGPETPTLLPWLRSLGWRTTLIERRERWRPLAVLADVAWTQGVFDALGADGAHDAALVMHHDFELDREALSSLATTSIGFVGLLGPARRRDDLFRVLPAVACAALAPRLRSPVGLPLGGQGPEAIALSIAAELQAHLHANR